MRRNPKINPAMERSARIEEFAQEQCCTTGHDNTDGPEYTRAGGLSGQVGAVQNRLEGVARVLYDTLIHLRGAMPDPKDEGYPSSQACICSTVNECNRWLDTIEEQVKELAGLLA